MHSRRSLLSEFGHLVLRVIFVAIWFSILYVLFALCLRCLPDPLKIVYLSLLSRLYGLTLV